MDNELVSIIMPAYNAEQFIEESINSALNQSYKNIELIIINDCSKDSTEEIIQKFMNIDNRIKYFKNKENLGVGKTRNYGVEQAKGNWIAFLDSDDLWEKDKIKKQIELVKSNKDIKFVFTGSAFIDKDNKKFDYQLQVPNKIDYKELLKQNLISCSSVMIKNEIILNNKMPQGFIHEDFATWLSILKQVNYAYGINEPLLIYRIQKNSKSGNKFKAAKMNWNTYKYVGLNIIQCVWYMCNYIVKNLMKYRNIK